MPNETPQGPIGVAVAAAKDYVDLILKGPLGELGGLTCSMQSENVEQAHL